MVLSRLNGYDLFYVQKIIEKKKFIMQTSKKVDQQCLQQPPIYMFR